MRDPNVHLWARAARLGRHAFSGCAVAVVVTVVASNIPAVLATDDCSGLAFREEAQCMESKIGFFLGAYGFVGVVGVLAIALLALGLGERQGRRFALARPHERSNFPGWVPPVAGDDPRLLYAGAAARLWFAWISTIVVGILLLIIGLLYAGEGGDDRLDFNWMASMVLAPTLVCLVGAALAWPRAWFAFQLARRRLATAQEVLPQPASAPSFRAYGRP